MLLTFRTEKNISFIHWVASIHSLVHTIQLLVNSALQYILIFDKIMNNFERMNNFYIDEMNDKGPNVTRQKSFERMYNK